MSKPLLNVSSLIVVLSLLWCEMSSRLNAFVQATENAELGTHGFAQSGYNESGQPVGVENYRMDKLVGDVGNVIRHFNRDKAIIIGHDWGGTGLREI